MVSGSRSAWALLIVGLMISSLCLANWIRHAEHGQRILRHDLGPNRLVRLSHGRLVVCSSERFHYDLDARKYVPALPDAYSAYSWRLGLFLQLNEQVELNFSGETLSTLTCRSFVQISLIWPAIAGLLVASLGALRLRSRTSGFCPTCNYDLRATPDRCPECGAIATKGAGI